MDELAVLCTDPALADRLKTAAADAAAEVPVEQRIHAAVGHNRYPVAPLVLGTTQTQSSPSTSAAANSCMRVWRPRGFDVVAPSWIEWRSGEPHEPIERT